MDRERDSLMKSFFKYMSIPLTCLILFVGFCVSMAVHEESFNNMVRDEALKGNRSAIYILRRYSNASKLDKKIVKESLKGNKFANEIIGIEEVKR